MCVNVYECVKPAFNAASASLVSSVPYCFDIFSYFKEIPFQSKKNCSTPASLSRELYRILVVVLVLFMYYNRAWFANSGLRAGRDDWNARSQLNLIIDFVGRQSLEGVFH